MEIDKSASPNSSVGELYSRLVYTSILLEEFNNYDAMRNIINKSQEKNSEIEICGEIIWESKKSSILQILEGPSIRVNVLMNIIKKDCRHKEVKIIACEDITKGQKIYTIWEANTPFNDNLLKDYVPEITHFQIQDIIGSGGFSTVVKSYNSVKEMEYAIKVISKRKMSRNLYNSIIRERNIWKDLTDKCNNNFINKLYWTLQDGLNIYFVMDLVKCGDMFDLIKDVTLDNEDCLFYFCEILSGLNYIHYKNIIYRDLKLENILMKPDGHILLTDFGISQKKTNIHDKISGTPLYFSPEMITDKIIDKKNDIWALGIILYEMTGNIVAWQGASKDIMFSLILQSNLNLDIKWGEHLNELFKMCIIRDHTQRKQCKEIINYIITNNIVNSWQDVEDKNVQPKIIPPDKYVKSNIFTAFTI